MYSIWEKQSYLKNDLIIIGGGIVGLSVGCSVLEKHPEKKVVILERGIIPTGASTKNAGLLATSSFTEFMEDIEKMGEKKSVALFFMRHRGYTRLLQRLGEKACDAKFQGSYEMIEDEKKCNRPMLKYANNLLKFLFKREVFVLRNELIDEFGFNKDKVKMIVENVLDGQLDTGSAMRSLYKHFTSLGGLYLTGSQVTSYKQIAPKQISVNIKNSISNQSDIVLEGSDLVLCTNGFTKEVTKADLNLVPGRGQVVVTKPIKDLKFKGTFHYDEGYYYFRDFYDRIIFGGGRNTDFQGETTTQLGNTTKIINNLEHHLKTIILPNTPFEIDYEWSGIMCFSKDGKDKGPIIEKESENVYYAVRMNGLGVALASNVGEEVAGMLYGFTPAL